MSEHIQRNADTATNNNDILLKEIDLIQSCINRMAQNSFVIKGWAITLNGIILGLFFDKAQNCIVPIICIISVLLFWWLDGFFLKTEKLYRWKYEWVIDQRPQTTNYSYDLNPYNNNMWLKDKDQQGRETDKKAPTILSVMCSKTLLPLYLVMVIINGALILYA